MRSKAASAHGCSQLEPKWTRIRAEQTANDPVVLGPDSVGQFIPTAVKTIQRKRAAVHSAEAGQSVSFALKRIRRTQVRKGMVLMAKTDTPPKGELPTDQLL